MARQEVIKVMLVTIGVLILASLGSTLLSGAVEFKSGGVSLLATRLMEMSLMALVIERSVEVYLRAFGLNGPDRHNSSSPAIYESPATGVATGVALCAGLIAGLLGVRVVNSFIVFSTDQSATAIAIWNGLDILLSAGLLAGGAVFLHEIVETLVGGVRNLNAKVSPGGQTRKGSGDASNFLAFKPVDIATTSNIVVVESTYSILVERSSASSGRLRFNHGNTNIDTQCWWDPEIKIEAGVYAKCSKTRMQTKTDSVTGEKRPGIFLPDAVAPDTGKKTIFIHEGKDSSWSDGCIVLNRNDMIRLWNEISPSNGFNVTVSVVDA